MRAVGERVCSGRVQGSIEKLVDKQHKGRTEVWPRRRERRRQHGRRPAMRLTRRGGGTEIRLVMPSTTCWSIRLPTEASAATERGRMRSRPPWRCTASSPHGPSDAIGSGLRYLRRRQRSDGAIRYSSSSQQTPVWVTAQALPSSEAEAVPASIPFPLAVAAQGRARSSACAVGAGLGFGAQCGGRSDSDGGRRGTRAASGTGGRAGTGGDSSGEGWRQRRTQPLGSPLS